MSSESAGGFRLKAVRDPLYKVPFSYVCTICNKKTKPRDGHAHLPIKLTGAQIKARQNQRKYTERWLQRKKEKE